jgi:outer membrane immunogenic protein
VGGNVGHGWGGDGTIDPRASGFTTGLFPSEAPFILASELATLSPLNTNPKGFLGGVQTGYNYQVNKFVFGIEADYAWANIAGSNARSLHSEFNIQGEPGFGITTNMMGQEKLDSLATVRARLGITPIQRGLLYATGGLAFGHTSSSIAISQIETGPTCPGGITFTPSSGSASGIRTGWTAGAGGEWAVASNWSAKAEYLYYDLGALQYIASQITGISCAPASTPFTFVNLAPSAEFKGSIVRFGLNFKFGGP